METKPIFVLGSPRSGTSIISTAIKSGAGVVGHAEGHFSPLLTHVMTTIENYYEKNKESASHKRRTLSYVNRDEFEDKIVRVFRNLYENIIHEQVWIDKTPGHVMIEAAPYILKAWPQSRFIFAKRRGIECIASRLRKFPHVPFETHCKLWKLSMENWLAVKASLKGHYLEIDQRDIALDPKNTSKKIGNFLEFSEDKINEIENVFTTKRPESTGDIETTQAIKLAQIDWTEKQINLFKKYCNTVSKKYNYSNSSSYYKI